MAFKESLKALEADVQHANEMALSLSNEAGAGGHCIQMRVGFGPACVLCFFRWANCHLVGALGLLHILIYKVMHDGTTTMSFHERRASLHEFYGYILPSLWFLGGHIPQKENMERGYNVRDKMKRYSGDEICPVDIERDKECGICLDIVAKVVLPDCKHSMCVKCYKDWRTRSASCPFCCISVSHVHLKDLWVWVDCNDIPDIKSLKRENMRRLLMYVEKLPLVVSKNNFDIKTRQRSIGWFTCIH